MAISIDVLLKVWDQFKRQPIVAMLFLCTLGLGYIYVDLRKETNSNKKAQTKQNIECNTKVGTLENKVTFMEHESKVRDSTLSAINAQWKLMQKLGLIKLPD